MVRVSLIVAGAEGLADPAYPAETVHKTDDQGRIKVVFPSRQVADSRLFVSFAVSYPGYVEQSTAPTSLAQLDVERRQGDRPSLGVIELERGLEYKGRALAPDGRPAADVPFEFSTRSDDEVMGGIVFQPSNVRGRTDEAGRIHLRAVVTDVIDLRLTPTRWAERRATWGSDPRDPFHKTWNRQDLGEHRLTRGQVITGRLLDLKGRPMPRQRLAVVGDDASTRRSAETRADGRFAFAPLQPGQYLVGGERQCAAPWNPRNLPPSPADAVIRPALVLLTDAQPLEVELHEVETVTVVIHHVDSRGRPVRGGPVNLTGFFPEPPEERDPTDLPDDVFHPLTEGPQLLAETLSLFWVVQALAGADGTLVLRAPRGVAGSLEIPPWLSTMSYRVRLSKDSPLEAAFRFDGELGLLDEDRREITVVWYRSPTVFVRIRCDESKLPDDARVIFTRTENGSMDETDLTTLSDGRTRGDFLLPDVEYSARAEAEGYEGPEVKFRLPEGAVKELTVELKRVREAKKYDDPQEGAP
jgi:hypothetical protein